MGLTAEGFSNRLACAYSTPDRQGAKDLQAAGCGACGALFESVAGSPQRERWRMEKIDLFKEPRRFSELPRPAKMAFYTLLAGWLVHFTIIYSVFRNQFSDTMLLQHAGLAVISCFVLLKLKNWARILCITGNVIVILFYLFLFVAVMSGSADVMLAAMTLLNLLLFGASTFFLWKGETADFFKSQSAKPPQSASR
jgi:hypothetical protein